MLSTLIVLLALCGVVVVVATLVNSNVEQSLKNVAPKKVHLPHFDSSHGAMPELRTGYINVNASYGRNLFYWLFDNHDPSAPLIFWNTGGPGGSGEFGLFFELGPLKLEPDPNGGTPRVFRRNTGSYLKFGALLLIDQPAGVSFSFSTNTSDYALNSDTRSARDQFTFLREFLKVCPEYQGRDLWLTGESYAGVYTPMLADLIMREDATIAAQLQGIMIGNPVFRCISDEIGDTFLNFNLLFWHGLVGYDDAVAFYANNCSSAAARGGYQSAACQNIVNKISEQRYLGSDFDGDNVFEDTCTGNGSLALTASTGACLDNQETLMGAYLADPAVVAAIHARAPGSSRNWQYDQNIDSMIPFYSSLIAGQKRILVYSGDVDIQTVPFAYTMPCLAQLQRTRVSKWAPWTLNGHTAGHFEQFDTYTYATVRGGGHEAPAFVPLSTDALIGRFIAGNGSLVDDAASANKFVARRAAPLRPGEPGFFHQRPSNLMRALGIRRI